MQVDMTGMRRAALAISHFQFITLQLQQCSHTLSCRVDTALWTQNTHHIFNTCQRPLLTFTSQGVRSGSQLLAIFIQSHAELL